MALSLIRNSRLFVTYNVDQVTGVIATSGFTPTNTQEIQVLDGFSFSQNTNADTITLSEAGPTPTRGQRSFNNSLAPVDFSFSTYVRPAKYTTVTAEERFLWNALVSSYQGSAGAYTGSNSGIGSWAEAASVATIGTTNSETHQLIKFGLIIALDNTTFMIDNCVMDQATVDFGIDQIATIAWTGKGSALRRLATAVTLTDVTGYTGSLAWYLGSNQNAHVGFSNGYAGSARAKDTSANYIANKLSTAYIASGLAAYIGSSTNPQYNVPITGGTITFANNVTYLTPSNLGVVNTPITYFTGTRAVTGTLTAYLRTGGYTGSNMQGDVGSLFSALTTTTALASSENKYSIYVDLGGMANSNRISFQVPQAILQIPSVKSESVISADMNFTGQGGYSGSSMSYDITVPNELTIKYQSA